MQTLFEKSVKGRRGVEIAPPEVGEYAFADELLREKPVLPELSEPEVVAHYTALSKRTFGVDDGFYPLGSCTMKYNPKLHEEIASMPGFAKAHPLTRADKVQGSLAVIDTLSAYLAGITGMDAVTLQPCAGAHGEYTALTMIAAYHRARGEKNRNKIIVPDSAHGTNPASAAMAGFEVVNIKSAPDKGVDIEELKKAVGDDTAALMLTNPSTLGLFEKRVTEIAEIVHGAGGLMYYDGANLNAVMGIVRPGDMGFDIVHLNLHKTFSTPHGGGGPGSGPVGCKSALEPFLPNPRVVRTEKGFRFEAGKHSIGKVSAFYGNFGVYIKALAYIVTLGGKGLRNAAETAVLNANYLREKIGYFYPTDASGPCMHEFVLSMKKLKDETGVTATDVAKALIDRGVHPPTMYFPLIVEEALMFEPTESASKEVLDRTAEAFGEIVKEAYENPAKVHSAPLTTPVRRPDEAAAARNPVVRAELSVE